MLVSRFFVQAEFACRNGSSNPIDWTPYPDEWVDERLQPLAETADIIRDEWGEPVDVVSGFRTKAYNEQLRARSSGVAANSQHPQGRAADIRPRDPTPERVRAFIDMIERLIERGALPKLGGFGRYPGWAHIDVRPKSPPDHVARWDGAGFGSEPV